MIATTEIKKKPSNLEEYYEQLGVRPMQTHNYDDDFAYSTDFNKNQEKLHEERIKCELETDTNKKDSGVSEPYISQVSSAGSPSHNEKVYRAGRLYQFSTAENGSGEMIFGNIFELSFQAESHDLDAIREKLNKELADYAKIMAVETEQGKLVLGKAIDNIKNLYIWKLEQYADDKVSYIRKIKLCKAEDLINAQKS